MPIVSVDVGVVQGNFQFAVVADFDSVEGFKAYAAHPAHQEVIDRLVKPIVDLRAAVQF